jgi:hypothetical protein
MEGIRGSREETNDLKGAHRRYRRSPRDTYQSTIWNVNGDNRERERHDQDKKRRQKTIFQRTIALKSEY